MKHYNIPIFIPHLGCPFDCIYCDQKKIAAQSSIPDIADLVNIIDTHLSTLPDGQEVEVAFFGGNFTAVDRQLQTDYLEAVQPYLKKGRIDSIRISTRPDCIDEEILDFLASYGVKTIELGVQSLSDEVLKASARAYTNKDVVNSCHLVRSRHFDLGIQLMVGLPGDNYELDIDTTRKVIELHPDSVRIYPTLVINGTPLESMWKQGSYQALTIEEAVHICKEMLLLFQENNIKVIRMGLYPGEELRSPGVIVAGPFHPSFRELVEQAIFKEQALMAIKLYQARFGSPDELNIHVNYRDVSKMTGKHKIILQQLKQEVGVIQKLPLLAINIIAQQNVERDWVGISAAGISDMQFILSRHDFTTIRPHRSRQTVEKVNQQSEQKR